jgi:hypothetical protein
LARTSGRIRFFGIKTAKLRKKAELKVIAKTVKALVEAIS